MTAKEDWEKISSTHLGQSIEPISYTGANQFFSVNLSDCEIEVMKDENGDIRYKIFFEWMLPTFDSKPFWDFLVARMQSYMTPHMNQGWKPRWFDPDGGNVILSDHVARMFGCQQCQLIRGFPSVDNSWLTRCPINAIAPLKECMPRDAFSDMYRCIHFSDDYDDKEEWRDIFLDKKHLLPDTARH